MAHIHTKPGEHDHTVSAFIIDIKELEPRLILHMHKKLGRYYQFGGHIEQDETPWQAVEHEILEESGHGFSQLKLLQPVDRMTSLADVNLHPVPLVYNTHAIDADHSHTDTAFAFTTDQSPHRSVASGESQDIIRVTAEQLGQMGEDEILDNIKQIGLYAMDKVGEASEGAWELIPATLEPWTLK